MEFPLDISIIWLSLLLSLLFLMAFIFRCRYLPSFKRYSSSKKVNKSFRKIVVALNLFTERFHIVFRKIPTKEFVSNSIDEDQTVSFSTNFHFLNSEEEIIYGTKATIAHINYR